MIDLRALISTEEMVGEDNEETSLLKEMYQEAANFLSAFAWCEGVRRSFFGCGVGGICAVFFFQIIPGSSDVDEWLWVIVGDLPPAYLVTDQADDASMALKVYIEEMRAWVAAVEAGESVDDLIPVNVPPTQENATSLGTRLNNLEKFDICGR